MTVEQILNKYEYKRLFAIDFDNRMSISGGTLDRLGKEFDMSQSNSVIAHFIAQYIRCPNVIVTNDIVGIGKAAYYKHKKSNFEKNLNMHGWRWIANTYIEKNRIVFNKGQVYLDTMLQKDIDVIDSELEAQYKAKLGKDILIEDAFNIYGEPLNNSFRAIYAREKN